MLNKRKKAIILSIFLLTASFVFSQGMGAIFDEEYDNLPRRAELSIAAYERLPSSFSLRQYAPLPGDQGNYGTCVGWAAAYARTISESVTLNRTNQTETTQNVFSPVYIYRNIRPDDPECVMGAQIYTALDYMRDVGTVRMLNVERETSFPHVNLAYYRTVRNYPIAGYVTLFSRDDRQKPALISRIVKKSLSEGRPVIIGMNAPDSFITANEVWRPHEDPRYFYYGHALVVTGYDDNRYGGAFEVLNSWGRKWGNGGYIWIPYQVFVDFVQEGYEIIENITNFSNGIRFNGFVRTEITGTRNITPDFPITETRSVIFALNENGYYVSNERPQEGSRISHIVGTRESSYVYSFTVFQPANHGSFFSPVLLFPQAGVSALLNYNENTITLPGEIPRGEGTSYLITLYSKRTLDINTIMYSFVSTPGSINKRLARAVGDGYTTNVSFSENEAAFTAAPENPRTVAALITAINY